MKRNGEIDDNSYDDDMTIRSSMDEDAA